jgi:hypothetical protein
MTRRNPVPPQYVPWWVAREGVAHEHPPAAVARQSGLLMEKAKALMGAALPHWAAGRVGSYQGNLLLARVPENQAQRLITEALGEPDNRNIRWPNRWQADVSWDLSEANEPLKGVKSKLEYLARRRGKQQRDASDALGRLSVIPRIPWARGMRAAVIQEARAVDAWVVGNSASAKLFRKYRGELRVIPEGTDVCPRCAGGGYIDAFKHVEGGQCFECGGIGYMESR